MVTRRIGQLIARPDGPASATNPTYGRVFFALRKRFALSASECLLADVVATLSRRTGWCFASRAYFADLLGVSPRSVQRMLRTLRARGLIEDHPDNVGQIRPTSTWHRARLTREG